MQQQNCFVVHFFVAFCLLSTTQTALSMNQTLAQQLSKTQIAHAACVSAGRFTNFFQHCNAIIKNHPGKVLFAITGTVLLAQHFSTKCEHRTKQSWLVKILNFTLNKLDPTSECNDCKFHRETIVGSIRGIDLKIRKINNPGNEKAINADQSENTELYNSLSKQELRTMLWQAKLSELCKAFNNDVQKKMEKLCEACKNNMTQQPQE